MGPRNATGLAQCATPSGASRAAARVHYVYYGSCHVLTQRKLLTVIHVWHTKPQDAHAWLVVSWELLRRVQRVVNDALLRAPAHSADYLHMDDRSALTLNHLALVRDAPAEMRAGIEAQLLAAEGMLQRYALHTWTYADTMSRRHSRARSTACIAWLHAPRRIQTARMPHVRFLCCMETSSGGMASPNATSRCAAWQQSTVRSTSRDDS